MVVGRRHQAIVEHAAVVGGAGPFQGHALRLRHRVGFVDDTVHDGARVGVLGQGAVMHAEQGAERIQRRIVKHLRPQRRLHVGAERGRDPGGVEVSRPETRAVGESGGRDAAAGTDEHRVGVHRHPHPPSRRHFRTEDHARSESAMAPHRGLEHFHVPEPVLQGNHHTVVDEQRRRGRRDACRVVRFHRNQNRVERAGQLLWP